MRTLPFGSGQASCVRLEKAGRKPSPSADPNSTLKAAFCYFSLLMAAIKTQTAGPGQAGETAASHRTGGRQHGSAAVDNGLEVPLRVSIELHVTQHQQFHV